MTTLIDICSDIFTGLTLSRYRSTNGNPQPYLIVRNATMSTSSKPEAESLCLSEALKLKHILQPSDLLFPSNFHSPHTFLAPSWSEPAIASNNFLIARLNGGIDPLPYLLFFHSTCGKQALINASTPVNLASGKPLRNLSLSAALHIPVPHPSATAQLTQLHHDYSSKLQEFERFCQHSIASP